MKLLFVRHAESRGNLNGRWQGWLDEPLTDQGRIQADLLARRLRQWSRESSTPFLALYSSTLARAYQTASILAQTWGVPLALDGRLRERDVGVLQGLTWPEIEDRYPEIARTIRHRWTMPDLPGGETTVELADRVCQAIDATIARADDRAATGGGCIVVVSHGGAINAYFNRLVGRDDDMPFMFSFGNTSLSVIDVQNGRPRISLVNDMCHLDDG